MIRALLFASFLTFVSSTLLFASFLTLVSSCPDDVTINPCSCSSTFKRRSSVGNVQNQYHVSCANVTYSELKNIFKNISASQGTDEVFDHFSGSDLFKSNGFIADDFFAGLKIKSVSITHSNLVSFGAKAFKDVTDSLDLSYNDIEFLPHQLNLMIRKVNLSHNKLKEIKENTFASQTIDLSHNLIDLIRESAFKVDDVLNINLDGNNLNSNSIQGGFIRSFNKKGYSDLSLNLHLNYNQLTHLDFHVFSPLLQSPHTTIALANNPLKCDCRVKWILEAKRYDSTWSTVYPRIDSATCADGSDLVKEFYSKELNSCADEILREDENILSPCKLNEKENLRCYRSSYDTISSSISPLNSLFSKPVELKSLTLERVSFPEQVDGKGINPVLSPEAFEFFKVKELKIVNTNLKTIQPGSFPSSTFSLQSIDLSNNRLIDDDGSVFKFLSKFINLQRIDLSNNQLTVVPSGSLAKMSRVQTLNLQNNALKVVQRHAFTIPSGSSLYRSFNIDLQSNQLTEKSFEPHFVANIRDNVKVNLNLERNMIRTVDEEKSFLREIFDVFRSDEGTTPSPREPSHSEPSHSEPRPSEPSPGEPVGVGAIAASAPSSSNINIVTGQDSASSILDLFDDDFKTHRIMNHHSVVLNENPLVCSNVLRQFMRSHQIELEDCDDYSSLANRRSAAAALL